VAEIKITTSTTKESKTGQQRPIPDKVNTERHTTVRSQVADCMTAWGLRDFVRALDAANVPDNVRIEASHGQNFHLTGLTAKFSETLDEEDTQDSVASS
jgi:hypothetical protein